MERMFFKKSIILIALIFLFSGVSHAAELSKEECRVVVKDFERMSNLTPADVQDQAPDILEKLREGETLTSYFIAYNIYVENLLNQGETDKARIEIEKMLTEALEQDDAECKVIALRAQGQFYYKLGIFDRAAECFRSAMDACPPYDSPLLESVFTWSSTLFWLVQTELRIGNIENAQHWMDEMDKMMVWLDARGEVDQVGYKPVMVRGLKAKIQLQRGDTIAARQLVEECPQYMQPDVPSRAYVEYYTAKMLLCVARGNHSEALPLLDELIEMHLADYKPIAAGYLYQKGLSLQALGRYEEATETMREYIELKEQVDRLALAEQLEELNTSYEVEKLQHERDNIHTRFLIALAICIALAVIITLIFVSRKRLQKKNTLLARHISELNRLDREKTSAAATTSAAPAEPAPSEDAEITSSAELAAVGNRIVEYIHRSQCYLRSDCSRDTIKDGVGVNERVLAKAIVAATGVSFVNYINQLRLKRSIEMLEEDPDKTIVDISVACGFGTVRQFQRIFKQRYDLSPSAYRDAFNSAKG